MTEKSDDASHVYRGYRKQILFILYRILTGNGNDIFCPEGIEDFSIETNGKTTSIFQVKDYSTPLSISDLSSGKPNSFIKRMLKYVNQYPETSVTVVYFGSLGPELKKIEMLDEKTVSTAAERIATKENISVSNSTDCLQKLKFLSVDEQNLTYSIDDILKETQLGLDSTSSKDLLFWWLFEKSERRERLSHDSVIKEIQNVGKFVRESSLSHEWIGSIVPFSSLISLDADKKRLKGTYLEGISATMDHIACNMDVIRKDKLDAVAEKLKKSNIVVIRGASGQGKTSLALRYFYDHIPAELSYKIKAPEDRDHAYGIAEAILAHHTAFDMPLYLYYDVGMADSQWPYIMEHFSGKKNVYLLMTIRNEDWHRNNATVSEKVAFEELELDFSREEAAYLYEHLPQSAYTDFESSWAEFGGSGPLLEYMYQLHTGQRLKDRLAAQVQRIKEEANQNRSDTELKFLEIVAMADSYGTRIEINKLHFLHTIPSPELILEKLKKEYLLTVTEDGKIVTGFHPVRSRILSSLLFDDVFHPWIAVFSETLEAVAEKDLETFLLYSFNERNTDTIAAIQKILLTFSSETWIGHRGIIRSLLWLGIKQYAEENRYLVDDLKKNYPHLDFILAFDADIGKTSSDLKNNIKNLFKDAAPTVIPVIEKYQQMQTDKEHVFIPAKQWISEPRRTPVSPSEDADFLACAETAYWYGYLNIYTTIFTSIGNSIEQNIDKIDISTLAELKFGFHMLKQDDVLNILQQHKNTIFHTFSKNYGILGIKETPDTITAPYVIEITDTSCQFETSKKENNNEKSMSVINLLRKLYPDKEFYSTRAYGSQIIYTLTNIPDDFNDGTYKKIPRKNLPSPYNVQLNSIFTGYMGYAYRPQTWKEYTTQIITVRELIVDVFWRIAAGLKKYYKIKNVQTILNAETLPVLLQTIDVLQQVPPFPKQAVDPWGLVKEEQNSSGKDTTLDVENIPKNKISLEKYETYRKICQGLFSSCLNFLTQLQNFIHNKKEEGKNLPLYYLEKACTSLAALQQEFHTHFSTLYGSLISLEHREKKVYRKLFSLLFFFSIHPDKKISNADTFCVNYTDIYFKNRLLEALKHNLENSLLNYKIQEGLWDKKTALWISGDILNLSDLVENNYAEIGNHLSGNYFMQEWIETLKQFDRQELTYLLPYHWEHICLVFTYKNRVIIKSIKQLNPLATLYGERANIFDIPLEDFSVLQNLSVNDCWDNKQIQNANSLLGNFVTLRAILNHVTEVLDELDKAEYETDGEVLSQYLTDRIQGCLKYFQDFLDALIKIEEIFDNKESAETSVFYSKDFCQLLFDQCKSFFPDYERKSDVTFNNDFIRDWKKRIENKAELISSCYFTLVFDALSYTE
jgi:hypothetical protein